MNLDQRIAHLRPEVEAGFREELNTALRTLRDAQAPVSVLLAMSRLCLRLVGEVLARAGHARPSDNLYDCINKAAKGDGKKPGLRLLPDEMASYLHTIRTFSNKPDHAAEQVVLTVGGAENMLRSFLRVLEWCYCEYVHGPCLPALYTVNAETVTLQQCFADYQHASAKQILRLEAKIELLREEQRQQSQRARETTRQPIPVPLPQLRGTFVDRVHERDTLHQLLRAGGPGLAVIVAPGGYGKTELTTKVLKEIAPSTSISSPDVQGILYVRCVRGEVSLGRIFANAGRIAGRSEEFQQAYANREWTLGRKLEFFLSELSRVGVVWLVLDNFEDLLDAHDRIADEEVRALVETAAALSHNVRFIVTTRAMPRFKGSQRLKPIDLQAGLPESEALNYLRAEGSECGLDDAPEELLRALARRVHGIPKALESVIGYLAERYPMVQLAEMLADDTRWAAFDRYDSAAGLKRLIAEQWHGQTAEAQLALCALSVFEQPVPEAALRYVLPALDWESGVLARLYRNRLVIFQGHRYDLHPSIRAFAYSQIPAEVLDTELILTEDAVPFTRRALHARAADFFRELRAPREQWRNVADLEPQLNEIRHWLRAEQYDEAAEVLDTIDFNYLQLWGQAHTVMVLREQLLGKLMDSYLEQGNAGYLGHVYKDTGRAREAITHYEQALQLARVDHDKQGEGTWLGSLGLAYAPLGEPRQAIEYYEQALALSREISDRRNEGAGLGYLGVAYAALGETRRAMEHYQQALALAREVGDQRNEGAWLGTLGVAYANLGEMQQAMEHYQQALALAREIGDKYNESMWLGYLSEAYANLGDMVRAEAQGRQALALAREISNPYFVTAWLNELAEIRTANGQWEEARQCFAEAVALDVPETRYQCVMGLALVARLEHDADAARRHSTQAAAFCRELLAKTPGRYEPLYALALARLIGGSASAARATYRQALAACAAQGIVQRELRRLQLLAVVVPPVDGYTEAVALLSAAVAKG